MHPHQLLLYAITDCDHITGDTLVKNTEILLQNGITMLQFRDKNRSRNEVKADAQALRDLCKRYHVPFIVNDDVELAREIDADGVHLGQSDAGCRIARIKLGHDKLIGVSAHNIEEAEKAVADGADYLGCGAMFPTASKEADTLNHDLFKAICEHVNIPVVAIGGIHAKNAQSLMGLPMAGIAVISALYQAEDKAAATKELLTIARHITDTPEPPKISAIICNIDGTLCDTLQAWDRLPGDYLARQNITAGPDLNRIIADRNMPEAAAYIKHNYSVPDGITTIISDWEFDLRAFYRNEARRQNGCDAFLKELTSHNLPLIIASEAPKNLIHLLIEQTDLTAYIKDVISGVEERFSRTDASYYQRAAQLSEADPAGIWVIEDTIFALRSAQRAGFHAAAIRNHRHSDEDWEKICAEADMSFENIGKVAEWLSQI